MGTGNIDKDINIYEGYPLCANPWQSLYKLELFSVAEARASIIGSNEVHIEEGSQLALECQVLQAPVPPIYIFWYHNGTMINYNRNLMVRTENFTSSLVVSKVTGRDAGTYTCEPQLAIAANVTVHVVTGK